MSGARQACPELAEGMNENGEWASLRVARVAQLSVLNSQHYFQRRKRGYETFAGACGINLW